CSRCGDFACAACLADVRGTKLCARCRERGGGALWPAGRAMGARAVFGHALARLPSHAAHAILMMVAFLPSQVAGMVMLKAQAAGGATPLTPFGAMSPGTLLVVMACSLGGMVLMLLGWPFVGGSVSASYADELSGRPVR